MRYLIILLFFVNITNSLAATHRIDKENSKLSFSGKHIDSNFTGTFTNYTAIIEFHQDNLQDSFINAEIDTSSFTTGNKFYDQTLPEKDWFNLKEFNQATFETTQIKHINNNNFMANGMLTLKGITQPLQFTFTLTPISTKQIKIESNFTIDRLAYNIGTESDPNSEWVSQYINIKLNLSAFLLNQ